MSNNFSFGARRRAFLRDRFRCIYCGRSVLTGEISLLDLTIDHFRPLSAGGKHRKNLRCSCSRCNSIKGGQIFRSVERARVWIEAERQRREQKLLAKMLRSCTVPSDNWDLLDLSILTHHFAEGEVSA